MTQDTAALIQIGQLLTKSGILTHESLAEALIKSKEKGLPIGTVLLMMGCIRQRDLRAAVEAQSLVNDRQISLDVAIQALMAVFTDGTTLDEALIETGWEAPAERKPTNKLGELLVDAGMLTTDQLGECLNTCRETGMPLGRVLTFRRTLSDSQLLAVLSAQRLIREGAVTRDIALKGLKAVRQRQISLEESLAEGGFYRPPPKKTTPIEYLLVEAKFLTDEVLMLCMELSLSEDRQIGQILVDQNYVTSTVMSAAKRCQELLDKGMLTRAGAHQALQIVAAENTSTERAIAQAGMPELTPAVREHLNELLVLTGLAEPAEMAAIDDIQFTTFGDFVEKLVATGTVDEAMAYAVMRALHLIEQKLLVPEDAVMALHNCKKNGTNLDEGLKSLHWVPPAHRKQQTS